MTNVGTNLNGAHLSRAAAVEFFRTIAFRSLRKPPSPLLRLQ